MVYLTAADNEVREVEPPRRGGNSRLDAMSGEPASFRKERSLSWSSRLTPSVSVVSKHGRFRTAAVTAPLESSARSAKGCCDDRLHGTTNFSGLFWPKT